MALKGQILRGYGDHRREPWRTFARYCRSVQARYGPLSPDARHWLREAGLLALTLDALHREEQTVRLVFANGAAGRRAREKARTTLKSLERRGMRLRVWKRPSIGWMHWRPPTARAKTWHAPTRPSGLKRISFGCPADVSRIDLQCRRLAQQPREVRAPQIARGYLADIEAGHRKNSSLAVLQRLAKALGVPVTELLDEQGDAGVVRHAVRSGNSRFPRRG